MAEMIPRFEDRQKRDSAAPEQNGLTGAAAAIAYAAALPLIAAAIIIWARPSGADPFTLAWMSIYGAALLSFFGGVRWGVAVMHPQGPTFVQLISAAYPLLLTVAIIAFGDPVMKLAALSIVFPILLLDDLRATRSGMGAPEWYLGVRVPLTFMMELSILAVLAAMVFKTA